MKRLIPKAKLEWKEPKAIRKARDQMDKKSLSPWFKPGVVVFSAAFLMLNWWLARQNPNKTPPDLHNALLLALFGGTFFAYGIPWMLSLCPSYIRIFEHGISRVIGNSASLWKFKDISRCEFASVESGESRQSALVIHTTKAKRIILGIPDELAAQAKQVLTEMNVKIEEIAQQPNPA